MLQEEGGLNHSAPSLHPGLHPSPKLITQNSSVDLEAMSQPDHNTRCNHTCSKQETPNVTRPNPFTLRTRLRGDKRLSVTPDCLPCSSCEKPVFAFY